MNVFDDMIYLVLTIALLCVMISVIHAVVFYYSRKFMYWRASKRMEKL